MDIIKKLKFGSLEYSKLIKLIAQIEKFQGKWQAMKINDNDFLLSLRHIATIQSIGSSTRIEGSQLNNDEVVTLLENLEISELESRDEQEVVGYWETLSTILDNFDSIELSESFIFQLHSLLLKYSTKDVGQKGKFKNISNKVIATYPDGTRKILFNTSEPFQVPGEMEALINWTNYELKSKEHNPLIIIASFVYEFLSIHPFHDGNGRLSRLLTTLLLMKEEYFFVQYVSFEHIIEKRKKEYYKVLMEGQKDRNTENEDISQWVLFFLECLISLTEHLEGKLQRIANNDVYLNERRKEIIELIDNKGKMQSSDIQKELGYAALATIKKDLKFLLDNKLILKKGQGRATIYFRK